MPWHCMQNRVASAAPSSAGSEPRASCSSAGPAHELSAKIKASIHRVDALGLRDLNRKISRNRFRSFSAPRNILRTALQADPREQYQCLGRGAATLTGTPAQREATRLANFLNRSATFRSLWTRRKLIGAEIGTETGNQTIIRRRQGDGLSDFLVGALFLPCTDPRQPLSLATHQALGPFSCHLPVHHRSVAMGGVLRPGNHG